MTGASNDQQKTTSFELFELLHVCMQDGKATYVVIDGLDECNDNAPLARNSHKLAMMRNVRSLLFSRLILASLNRFLPRAFQLPVDRAAISTDIRLFLEGQLATLVDEELLPPTTDTSAWLDHLVKGAAGMFLWAKLMIGYLNSPALTQSMPIWTITEVILPEGLDVMYNRILELIIKAGRTNQALARQVLTWLMHSMKPMSVRELQQALTTGYDHADPLASNEFKDLQDTVAFTFWPYTIPFRAVNRFLYPLIRRIPPRYYPHLSSLLRGLARGI